MYYSDDIIEEVRSRTNIVDLISGYVKLKRSGSNYVGLCPFHNEKTPSFSVSPSKQMYYCFGCGAGGNVFTFLQQYENATFPEAVKTLAERAGVSLPEGDYESAEGRRLRDARQAVMDVQKMAAKYYYYLLHTEQGAHAMEYLKGRGLTDETIRGFGLGYAGQYSNSLSKYLKKQGIPDDVLKESGLVQVSEKYGLTDKFWNRVMFPIMDVNNRVIGFGGRVMGDAKPKYLNSPETMIFDKSRNLYGLNVARRSRAKNLIVCEGYMDVIAMHQAGFTNAVASLGTALTGQHAVLLKRYTDEVILTYDSDEAGTRAALRAIPLVKEAGLKARVLRMDPYKDPDEFIKAQGGEAFQARIDQAENSFLFEVRMLERSHDMEDPESKSAFFMAVAEKIAGFEFEVEREAYIEAIARQYQVSFDGLRKMVFRWLSRGVTVSQKAQRPEPPGNRTRRREKEEGLKDAQRLTLVWLAEYPVLYQQVKDILTPQDFSDELYRQVAQILFGQLEAGKPDPASVADHFSQMEEQQEIARIFHSDQQVQRNEDVAKAFRESLKKVVEAAVTARAASMDPADATSLQRMIEDKKKVQSIDRMRLKV